MGYNERTLSDMGFTVKTTKEISGACPACGQKVNLKIEIDTSPELYKCLCGYMSFNADSERAITDNHNIPKEEFAKNRETRKLEKWIIGNGYEIF